MSASRAPSPPVLSRRRFLQLGGVGLLLAATACSRRGEKPPRIGLALGGGGAKGLAHIPVLETLDDLGIVPHRIAGTSIGAIVGALYAAGLSGRDIRALVEQFFVDQTEAERKLFALPKSVRWLDFIDPALTGNGLLNSDDFIEYIGEVMPARTFRELRTPLRVVTAELLTGREYVIDSGELLSALQATIAVPGVFPPVETRGRTLVDGGVANPLPFDQVQDCDITVAVNVSGKRELEEGETLSTIGVLLRSFHTMSNNLLAEKLRQQRPTVYVVPEIRNVQILEFYKARQVFAEAKPAARQLSRDLQRAIDRHPVQAGCSIPAARR